MTRCLALNQNYVTFTFIPGSSDFGLFLEGCFIFLHDNLGKWVSMTRHLASVYKKITVTSISRFICFVIFWRRFDLLTWLLGKLTPMIYPRVTVGHRALYLMVQWSCLISWRIFYVRTRLLGMMNHYDRIFELKTISMLQWHVLWFSHYALHIEDCLMFERDSWENDSIWPGVWLETNRKSQWPIYGPLIFPFMCIMLRQESLLLFT